MYKICPSQLSVVGLSMLFSTDGGDKGISGCPGVLVSTFDVSLICFLSFLFRPLVTNVWASQISLVTLLYLIVVSHLCSNSCDRNFSICVYYQCSLVVLCIE